MRFALTLCLTLAISLTANAAPWDVVPMSTEGSTDGPPGEAAQPQSPQLSLQRGGSSDKLRTLDSLTLTQYAKSLGKISAMATSEDGTLYAADYKTGRIWVLSDRGQDGTLDMRRPLAQTFKNPTGLAVIDETLYVADKQAVWAVAPDSKARVLAPLANAQSQGSFALIAEDDSLILGMTQSDSSLIVRINTTSGQAEKIAGFENAAPIHGLAKRKGAPLWVTSGNTIQSIDSPEAALYFSQQSLADLLLPGQYTTPDNWPRNLKETIIASQIGPKSMQLIAIPTEFGRPSEAPRVLVEGFLNGSGRSAWGQPGAIVMNKRGLFFADTHNGIIWRLSAKPEIETPKIVIAETQDIKNKDKTKGENKTVETKPKQSPLLIGSGIKGSQIGNVSHMGPASQLKTGSTIIDEFEKAEAEAEKTLEEGDKEPSKKRRSTR